MTRGEIDAMPAGREMDVLVLERVLWLEVERGLSAGEISIRNRSSKKPEPLPPYSTDFDAMLQALRWTAGNRIWNIGATSTMVPTGDPDAPYAFETVVEVNGEISTSTSFALAGCRAMLKAALADPGSGERGEKKG